MENILEYKNEIIDVVIALLGIICTCISLKFVFINKKIKNENETINSECVKIKENCLEIKNSVVSMTGINAALADGGKGNTYISCNFNNPKPLTPPPQKKQKK
jgi:hypothetical protein